MNRASSNPLCLACGLCCIGVVHSHAALGADELELARELELRVDVFEDGPGFHLPCPQYRDSRCAAYLGRPRACASYQCDLLERYLADQVTLEESVSLVTQARRMVEGLRARLPDGDATPLTFKVLRQLAGGQGKAPEDLPPDR